MKYEFPANSFTLCKVGITETLANAGGGGTVYFNRRVAV